MDTQNRPRRHLKTGHQQKRSETLTKAMDLWSAAGMANVLNKDRRQQVEALGRLGWSLRRIEAETGVRRETASAYLRAPGILVRSAGGSGAKFCSQDSDRLLSSLADQEGVRSPTTDT